MSNVDLTYRSMTRLARQMDQLFEKRDLDGPQFTIIWAPSDVGYGMARMFDAVANPDLRDISILESAAEVLEALTLPDDSIPDLIARG